MADLLSGALVSSLVDVLVHRLVSRDSLDFLFGKNLVLKLLEELKVLLLSANKLLDDAEEKQLVDRNVGTWLDLLADVALDADDLVDDIHYEALSQELQDQRGTSKFRRLFSVLFMNRFRSEIEDVVRRLKLLIDQKDALGLQEENVQRRFLPRPIVDLVEESDVYDRDCDKEFIVDLLLPSDCGEQRVSVIPIVGMGGIGKTTLAQLVYNDIRVAGSFDAKVWVTVSDDFDVFRVTRTIFEMVTSQKCVIDDLYQLQVELREGLRGKRFLFVLDDVWNENYSLWDVLKSAFTSGAHGSKIIVTTRSSAVARMVATGPIHYLSVVSEEGCWKLFLRHAFSTELGAYPGLVAIGREIVRKCKGLPLAVKSLGGLLRRERNPSTWESVLKSNVWELGENNSSILPALWLSYRYLPSHLKRCFAYCAIFPKDYAFEKEKLILLWMAEGLLQPKEGKRMEDIGEEYFQDLISRSLFQQVSRDESTLFMHDLVYDLATAVSNEFCFNFRSSCFMMHDLVNDLAKYVAGDFCFRLEGSCSQKIPKSARHFSYLRSEYEASKRFDSLDGAKCLRTFLPLNLSSSENFLSERVAYNLLPSLTCLRVLSVSHYSNLTKLPDSISNLKHLRYLDLSHTGIKMLPSSITTLYNLQTLKLSNCSSLTQLPSNIGRLVNLRHLCNDGTNLKEMPWQICHLKDLQTLTMFVLGKGRGASIKELMQLQNLRGTLSVLGLQNIFCAKDTLGVIFEDKEHLKELILEWDANAADSQKEREVLDKMQPHINLKRLTIKNYGGTRFPPWLGDTSFSNIVFLCLIGCKYAFSLPPLGQLPSLRELSVMGFDLVEKVGHEFCGDSSDQPFRCLEVLRFAFMMRWKEWRCFERGPNCGSFPRLRELYIENCKLLTGDFPNHLPELAELEIVDCPQLMVSLCKAPAVCQLDLVNFQEIILETIPSDLSWFSIAENHTIVSLPDKIAYNNTRLVELNISNCFSLVHLLTGDDLPPTLKVLGISGCEKLEFPRNASYEFLESLSICYSCSSLTSFPLFAFPKLNRLHMEGCKSLKSLSFSKEHFQDLKSLRFLQISECPNFLSFPSGGLPAPNLTWLVVEKCESLKSLPQEMCSCLSSLKVLRLSHCPELSSFPSGGLPSGLCSLSILSCDKLVATEKEWNLQRLSSLREFSIGVNGDCEELKSFPQVGMLPPALVSLYISGVPNMKSLNYEGLQRLKFLKELKIHNCPELQFIPEGQLPCSLRFIQIVNCHLLKETWRGKNKYDWTKIAQDACIQIDEEVIFTS